MSLVTVEGICALILRRLQWVHANLTVPSRRRLLAARSINEGNSGNASPAVAAGSTALAPDAAPPNNATSSSSNRAGDTRPLPPCRVLVNLRDLPMACAKPHTRQRLLDIVTFLARLPPTVSTGCRCE